MLIALTGFKGSGKDLFVERSKNLFPQVDLRSIAFADPIKQEFLNTVGCSDESLYDDLKRSSVTFDCGNGIVHHSTGRQILVAIGMRIRELDPNQFVNRVDLAIKESPASVWIVTDLRFDNEMEFVRRLGGVVIKIKRFGRDSEHISERGFDDSEVDWIIDNSGTVADYDDSIKCVLELILDRIPK